MAQKRKAISLETKYQVVSKRQRGEKPSYLIKEYGLSSSTVSTIFKNQEKIIAEYESNLEENGIKRNKDSMRIKEPTYQDIDSGVEEWFKQTIAQTNVVIGGPEIQTQALKYEVKMATLSQFMMQSNTFATLGMGQQVQPFPIAIEKLDSNVKNSQNWKKLLRSTHLFKSSMTHGIISIV